MRLTIQPGKIYYKVENVSVEAVRPEELQIKVEGSSMTQAFVPVGYIDIPTIR